MTERISRWQAHLAPILDEEERKASFDIHRYSEMLLQVANTKLQEKKRRFIGFDENQDYNSEEIPTNTKVIDFGSVAQGCTRSDVCRLFLASLSLANSGNLEIEEGCINYQFEVVSSKVKRPMETYRAPSSIVSR